MKPLIPAWLWSLALFLAPFAAFAAGAEPKAKGSGQPLGGAEARQSPAADPSDAGKTDSDSPDADQPQRAKSGARPTSMDIIPEPGGRKTLTIHFRWTLFPNASVETRLVPDDSEPKKPLAGGLKAGGLVDEPQTTSGEPKKEVVVAPIYFAENLKGTVRDDLFACLDHQGGLTRSFTKDKIVYKMIGGLNSLGKQGVHVQVYPENSTNPARNPAVAYLQLDTWAVDQETLALDLARNEFPKSGTLHVWFFRGEQNVWEEQIHWPGYK